jgi:hypothetical protein
MPAEGAFSVTSGAVRSTSTVAVSVPVLPPWSVAVTWTS